MKRFNIALFACLAHAVIGLRPAACAGSLLRVIDATLPIELRTSLDQHADDAQRAGWLVQDVYVAPSDAKRPLEVVELAESVIWPAVRAHSNTLHVFLIGNVPLPRSGFAQNPDGHSDTSGAYPAPVYYAMPDSTWTDERDNTGFNSRPLQQNMPGDGRFDQDRRPDGEVRAAIGVLKLSPAVRNKNWGFAGPQSLWEIEAYRRYFDALHQWRTGKVLPKHQWGCGAGIGSPSSMWLRQTSTNQPVWKSTTSPVGFETRLPYGAVYDFKGLPNNGVFWFERKVPVAALYLMWESYQTDFNTTRVINPLLSGSVASAPVGYAWIMEGWETKTIGELWKQSAEKSVNPWVALYGDPTFRLNFE